MYVRALQAQSAPLTIVHRSGGRAIVKPKQRMPLTGWVPDALLVTVATQNRSPLGAISI
jgi:hypothetical protein